MAVYGPPGRGPLLYTKVVQSEFQHIPFLQSSVFALLALVFLTGGGLGGGLSSSLSVVVKKCSLSKCESDNVILPLSLELSLSWSSSLVLGVLEDMFVEFLMTPYRCCHCQSWTHGQVLHLQKASTTFHTRISPKIVSKIGQRLTGSLPAQPFCSNQRRVRIFHYTPH